EQGRTDEEAEVRTVVVSAMPASTAPASAVPISAAAMPVTTVMPSTAVPAGMTTGVPARMLLRQRGACAQRAQQQRATQQNTLESVHDCPSFCNNNLYTS